MLEQYLKVKDHGFEQITDFAESKRHMNPTNELEDIRRIAPVFREKFMESGKPVYVRQLLCSISPYPTKYGFHNAYSGLHPFLYFNNRATLVQFEKNGEIKNLLFNPYFPELSVHSGFYSHLKETVGKFIPQKLLLKEQASILDQITAIGIPPEKIDYVSYDHLHVQDLRPLMGTLDEDGQPALQAWFPNAQFLFHKDEWDSVMHLHPLNEIWYVKDGFDRLDLSRLLLYDGDLLLAPGVALIHTKGHTPGNHSLYLHTDKGTFTISENGVGPDAYSPLNSRINAIRNTAKWKGWEVIMNANTQDYAFNQYNSMIKEKLLSGDSLDHPGYCNHRSSSEFTHWRAAPGLSPSIELGAVEFGSMKL